MKKLFMACVALVIALLVIVGIIKISEHKDSGMSDQEMMELYVTEVYGAGYYGELTEFVHPEHKDVIWFMLYEEGEARPMITGFERCWYDDYH